MSFSSGIVVVVVGGGFIAVVVVVVVHVVVAVDGGGEVFSIILPFYFIGMHFGLALTSSLESYTKTNVDNHHVYSL